MELEENKINIMLSDEASNQLKDLMQSDNKPFLRVWVESNSCCGTSYGMALDDSKEDDDLITEDKGVAIVVDNLSAQYLGGSTIEYQEDVLGGGFKINNPNAKNTCGCSSSFSTEDESLKKMQRLF